MRLARLLFAAFGLVVALVLSATAQNDRAFAVVPQTGPLRGKQVYANSYALIVGINAYPNVPRKWWLSHAVDDARALRDELIRHYGFPAENITLLTDGDAAEKKIRNALASFTSFTRIKKDDRILVYFSGHGQTIKQAGEGMPEMGFLVPYDAEVDLGDLANPEPYLRTCIPMRQVWEYLDASPAKHILVLADACYSGLLAKTRAFGEEAIPDAQLQSLASERTRQVITAGRKGETAVELDEVGHGAFTHSLLELLKKRATVPGEVFTSNQLYTKLFPAVGKITQGKQTPQLSNHETEGQFLFITTPEQRVENGPAAEDTIARVFVKTDPPGAKIFVDGREFTEGKTPFTIAIGLGGDKVRNVEIAVELNGERKTSKVALVAGRFTQLPLLQFTTGEDRRPQPAPVEPPRPPVEAPRPPADGPRPVSKRPVELFNGIDLTGWKVTGNGQWRAYAGILVVEGEPYGQLATTREYGDFELDVETRLTAGSNTGVMFHGMEFQIQDDNGYRDFVRDHPLWRTGSIGGFAGPTGPVTLRVGEWNRWTIRSQGPWVSVRLNLTEILRVSVDQFTAPGDRTGSVPLAQQPRRSAIGLQSHTGRVDFRNVRIREL